VLGQVAVVRAVGLFNFSDGVVVVFNRLAGVLCLARQGKTKRDE